MAQISSLEKYQFKDTDQILVDTNIWLFIFGPSNPRNDPKMDLYSRGFKKILDNQSNIYIDTLIISEFVNAYARYEWKASKKCKNNFKQFRNLPEFQSIAETIKNGMEQILKLCHFIDDGCTKSIADKVIAEFNRGNYDYNDQVLIEICKKKGLIIVTDDGDFKNGGIPIITGNPKLLK